MTKLPRILIAAPASGSGKTTISVGIMAALARGMAVQSFKVGPDFIDPMYHTAATGRISRNLDTWMTSPETVRKSFERAGRGAEVAVVEGVMGLYDGFDAVSDDGSSAGLAKILNIPIILVIDASRMARSAAAIVLGCRDYDPAINLAGVICNHVSGEQHAAWLRQAIEGIGVPLLGCIPSSPSAKIPERHLGLWTVQGRQTETQTFIQCAADLVTTYVDLERLLAIARDAPDLPENPGGDGVVEHPTVRIGVAHDEAFCFYYEDNFDALRKAGAEIVFFSPLRDVDLPENVAGIYLGGGYPELNAERLMKNKGIYSRIHNAFRAGMPIYAECGGYLWLGESLTDMDGHPYPGLGLLPGAAHMQSRLHLGYRWVEASQDTLLLRKGEKGRGHEFHYSVVECDPHNSAAFHVGRTCGAMERSEGYSRGSVLASFVHLHFDSNPAMAANFVAASRQWQETQSGILGG